MKEWGYYINKQNQLYQSIAKTEKLFVLAPVKISGLNLTTVYCDMIVIHKEDDVSNYKEVDFNHVSLKYDV
jgi:hypothetical protein